MTYHLQKASRPYLGEPYSGPTSNGFPAEFESFEAASDALKIFTKKNSGVGWNI